MKSNPVSICVALMFAVGAIVASGQATPSESTGGPTLRQCRENLEHYQDLREITLLRLDSNIVSHTPYDISRRMRARAETLSLKACAPLKEMLESDSLRHLFDDARIRADDDRDVFANQ